MYHAAQASIAIVFIQVYEQYLRGVASLPFMATKRISGVTRKQSEPRRFFPTILHPSALQLKWRLVAADLRLFDVGEFAVNGRSKLLKM